MTEGEKEALARKLFAGRLLLVILEEVYEWCGKDYPGWEEIENAIAVAKESDVDGQHTH